MFSAGPAVAGRLVLLAALSIALMMADYRSDALEPARSTLGMLIYPLQYALDAPARVGRWTNELFTTRQALAARNRTLARDQALLRGKLQRLSALERENLRLRELLGSTGRFRHDRLLVAELLAVDLDPFKQQIVVNKGDDDGLYRGQPLLDAHGVMGQITHLSLMSATALLISDPSHALPVEVDRNGLRTLAVGTGNPNRLHLRHVPTSADVRVGDTVSTSGLGGRYPPDYPVGEIRRIVREPGAAFATIEARPFARLDRAHEVMLVWAKPLDAADTVAGGRPVK